MKLFAYEFKKNIFRVSVLILALGLILVNVYKQYESVKIRGANGRTIVAEGQRFGEAMYNDFKGEITPELIQRIKDYKEKADAGDLETLYCESIGAEQSMIENIEEDVRRAYLYPNEMSELRRKCDEALDFYDGKNAYETEKHELIKRLYSDRRITTYGFFGGYMMIFDYEFSSFLIIIMLIFLFSPSFAGEKAIGADRIIRSCGRARSVFWAKHCTMYAFIAFAAVAFMAIDFAGFSRYYKFEFGDQPLYSINIFRNTPFNVSVVEAVFLAMIFRVIALIFAGEIIMLISTFTKNIGAAMTASFAAIIGLVFASAYIKSYLNPFTLFNAQGVFEKFECVNVLGKPVLSIFATVFVTIILTAILHVICYLRTAKKFKAVTN